MNHSSQTVREHGKKFLGDNGGAGDQRLELWENEFGVEFIITNGDPVWESEEGFQEVAETLNF